MREFNLCKLMSGLARVFETEAWDKGVDFTCRIRTDVPQDLQGDETRLCLLLSQLYLNAIEFTEKGAVSVLVSHVVDDAGMGAHRFAVRDTGCGMSPSRLNGLRDFLAGKTDKALEGSAGLGLSIALKMADQLGGRITVDSREGEGTEFTVEVPFFSQAGSESLPCKLEQPAKILVIDDNEINRLVVTNLLERMGHEVFNAGGGERALDLLARESFTLIFLDLQMPDMDGYETARRMRGFAGDGEAASVPIVAMTAHGQAEDDVHCLAAGMNDFLIKPVEREDLQGIIKSSLESDGGRRRGWKFLPVLDQDDLRRRINDDEELIADLLDLFLDDMPQQIKELRAGLAAGDQKLTTRKAHTMKGAAANIGAFAMREVAAVAEGLANRGDLEAVAALCPRLTWELGRVRDLAGQAAAAAE